jgi:hypothetical protein
MKTIKTISYFICLILLFQSYALGAKAIKVKKAVKKEKPQVLELKFKGDEKNGASIVYIKGEVSIKGITDTDWKIAVLKDRLEAGGFLRVGSDSSADIIFDDGSYLHLCENTSITVTDIQLNFLMHISKILIYVLQGAVIVDTPELVGKGSEFKVRSDAASAYSRGSKFIFEVYTDKTVVAVQEGLVFFNSLNKDGSVKNTIKVNKLQESMVYQGLNTSPAAKLRNIFIVYAEEYDGMNLRLKNNNFRKDVAELTKIRKRSNVLGFVGRDTSIFFKENIETVPKKPLQNYSSDNKLEEKPIVPQEETKISPEKSNEEKNIDKEKQKEEKQKTKELEKQRKKEQKERLKLLQEEAKQNKQQERTTRPTGRRDFLQ